MYVCICMHMMIVLHISRDIPPDFVCVCVCVCVIPHECACVRVPMYKYIHTYIHTHTHVHTLQTIVGNRKCIHMCIHAYIHTHTHIHTHVHTIHSVHATMGNGRRNVLQLQIWRAAIRTGQTLLRADHFCVWRGRTVWPE